MKIPALTEGEGALADWEGEGGHIGTPQPDAGEPLRGGCVPPLPPGCEAQPAWGFIVGGASYELVRVYRPPRRSDRRGPICQLDEDLSYWSVVWSGDTEHGDAPPRGRWLTFARARELRGGRLSFARFSSLQRMREALAGRPGPAPATQPAPASAPGALVAATEAPFHGH